MSDDSEQEPASAAEASETPTQLSKDDQGCRSGPAEASTPRDSEHEPPLPTKQGVDVPLFRKLSSYRLRGSEYDELFDNLREGGRFQTDLTSRDYIARLLSPSPLDSSAGLFSEAMKRSVNWSALAKAAARTEVPQLETGILELRQQLDKQTQELLSLKQSGGAWQKKIEELEQTIAELRNEESLALLLARVGAGAHEQLRQSSELRAKFFGNAECQAFVISVDIRRSTDLMLKARTPRLFAGFIMKLCDTLSDIVKRHGGVVDKFTGDGILAFFPDFFSGKDAGFRALSAANDCHAAFKTHYQNHRTCFSSVLQDVGLGIGIDYGTCHVVSVAGGITVVGVPVVYACRLGGAPAGSTLLNQPAYEMIVASHGRHFFLEERSIEIKHEGTLLVYEASRAPTEYQAVAPPWESVAEVASIGSNE